MEVKEMTVRNTSVGADDGQSLKTSNYSITDLSDECKSFDVTELSDKPGLKTVTMSDLFDRVYQGKPPIIDGLLYRGIYLFVGAPKIGKSFFMAQLAYHVSTGTPLWNYPVRKGTVLYQIFCKSDSSYYFVLLLVFVEFVFECFCHSFTQFL